MHLFQLNLLYSRKTQTQKNKLDNTKLQGLILLPKKSILQENTRECIDFDNSNFSNSDLSGAYWEFACLNKSQLIQISLEKSIIITSFFNNSNLQKAYFCHTRVYKSSFSNANLQKATFYNSDLRLSLFITADLSGAFLYNSNFDNTILFGTNLQDVYGFYGSSFLNAQYNSEEITLNDVYLFKFGNQHKEMINAYCMAYDIHNLNECLIKINSINISEALPTKFSKLLDPKNLGMYDVSKLVKFARKFYGL